MVRVQQRVFLRCPPISPYGYVGIGDLIKRGPDSPGEELGRVELFYLLLVLLCGRLRSSNPDLLKTG